MFINNIRGKIDSESRVFVAFKVNPICDLTSDDPSFESEFKKMKFDLQQDGVHIASLNTNLRNTKCIGDVSRNTKTFNTRIAEIKMTQHIQPLFTKSTDVASSIPPLQIPMHRKHQEKHLKQALKRAVERAKQSTKNVVIIFNERYLSSNEVYQSLLKCGEATILIHPKKSKNEDPTLLINYLKNPKGIYLVPSDNFIGMESNSVIFTSSKSDGYDEGAKSIRCNISRAVAQLTIIMELNEDGIYSSSNKILFHSTEVDPKFVECRKTIKFHAFKCNSIHFNSSSTSPSSSSSLLPSVEQQQNQESSSTILKWLKPKKYVCEACIHVCHNNHKDRLFVKLGGGAYSTLLGGIRSLIGDGVRSIKIPIVGETRCCCNEITNCQLPNGDTNSSISFYCFRIAFWCIIALFL